MRVTASSADSTRECAAKAIRRDNPPGPVRAAALRAVGILATAEDNPGGVVAPPTPAEHPHASRSTSPDHEAFAEFASGVRASLIPAEDGEATTLWLPGLQLESENRALRGGKGKNSIRVAAAAKRAAMRALTTSDAPLVRYDRAVSIEVRQVGTNRRIDPGNLWHKPIIDLLLRNGDGLGVIHDDSARYVESVTVGYADGNAVGVLVTITPCVESHQSPRRASLPPGSPARGSLRSSHSDADPVATASGAVKEAGRATR